jgi:hypothetical protein
VEGSGPNLIEVLSRNFLEGPREATKASVGISGVTAEIRTEHLSNTRLQPYRCANPLDCKVNIGTTASYELSYVGRTPLILNLGTRQE